MRKIFIALDGAELSALNTCAQAERRDPRAQAALIIREALERRGLLPVNVIAAPTDTAQTSGVIQNAIAK